MPSSKSSGSLPPPPGALRPNGKDGRKRLMYVVLGGVALAGGLIAYASLSGNGQRAQVSAVPTPPPMRSEAGGQEHRTNPAVAENVRRTNENRVAEAERTGGSAIPTFGQRIMPEVQTPAPPTQQRAETNQRPLGPPQTPVQQQAQQAPPIDTNPLNDQMKAIMAGWGLRPSQIVQNGDGGASNPRMAAGGPVGGAGGPPRLPSAGTPGGGAMGGQGGATLAGAQGNYAGGGRMGPRYGRQFARMGDVLYGHTIAGSVSRVRTPQVIQIDSPGPLRGARIAGNFQKTDEGLVFQLTNLSLPNNQGSITVSAYAMNPETQLPEIADSIDRQWFSRYIVKSAAAFGSTLASAYGRAASAVTLSPFGGASYTTGPVDIGRSAVLGAGRVGEELFREIDRSTQAQDLPIITVEAGRSVAIVFTEDAVQESR